MTTETVPCLSNRVAGPDLLTGNMTVNLPDTVPSKAIVNAPYITIKDIQLDLVSFIFGLSELHMRMDRQSDLDVRISLLKNCVEDTKRKIDKLIKYNALIKPQAIR